MDEQGRPIGLTDGRTESLAARARSTDPLAFVADAELFGDLVDDERCTAADPAAPTSRRTRGVRATSEMLG